MNAEEENDGYAEKYGLLYTYDAALKALPDGWRLPTDEVPVIPYKYTVEMICDQLAAGITYNGKNWRKDTQLKYWRNIEKENIDKEINQIKFTKSLKKYLSDKRM